MQTRVVCGHQGGVSQHALLKILQVVIILGDNREHPFAVGKSRCPRLGKHDAGDRLLVLDNFHFFIGFQPGVSFAQGGLCLNQFDGFSHFEYS